MLEFPILGNGDQSCFRGWSRGTHVDSGFHISRGNTGTGSAERKTFLLLLWVHGHKEKGLRLIVYLGKFMHEFVDSSLIGQSHFRELSWLCRASHQQRREISIDNVVRVVLFLRRYQGIRVACSEETPLSPLVESLKSSAYIKLDVAEKGLAFI